MTYTVKEIFKTLQGEGAQAGRPAVFCRFSGCNLWSGRETDRASALCTFCDTDFVGTDGVRGGKYESAGLLADAIAAAWGDTDRRFVVLTGGEPLLQADGALVAALKTLEFEIAVETNGTIEIVHPFDWVCVSPKSLGNLKVTSGDELKMVFPQAGFDPASLVDLRFAHFWLQPMDGVDRDQATVKAVDYCLAHPRWRLSLQTHKLIGIP